MNDDDLDRLLSNVDGESEYSSAREESLKIKQRMARKSDVTVEAILDDGASDEAFLQKMKTLGITDAILLFRGGVVNALREHEHAARRFREQLFEVDIPESISQIVQKHKYAFIRNIDTIERIFREYETALSPDSLTRKAKKDYPLAFSGTENANEIDFLVLKEIFIKLREFNSLVKKEWGELHTGIGVINLKSEGKPLFQALDRIVFTGVDLCDASDAFLRRLACILSIAEDDIDVLEKDIYNRIVYHAPYVYGYDAIFAGAADLDSASGLTASGADGASEGAVPEEDAIAPLSDIEAMEIGERQHEMFGKPVVPVVKFTVRGTSSWNTREPYVLNVNGEKLQKDYADLSVSFYFIPDTNQVSAQEGAVKRAMIRYLNDQSKNIEMEYEEFIYKKIISQAQAVCDSFEFDGEMRDLFVYHLGPYTLYRLIVSLFQSEKTGICFKYLPGNKVVRYIPLEFVKEKILTWYEENINTLPLEFDKVQYFDEIRRTVTAKYNSDVDKYATMLDQLIAKLNLSEQENFDRDTYFRTKWSQWFGLPNIAVFNRFVDWSIFK